jgi:N-acetylmuramoyl-L-alanine amidase
VKRSLALAAVLVGILAIPVSAHAVSASVTLQTSDTKIEAGEEVTLSGQISPASAGQTVEIRDPDEAVVATATTDASGAFSATISPDATVTLHAVWGTAVSEPVTVSVGAAIEVRLPPVRLFDDVTVHGTVTSVVQGTRATVELLLDGDVVQTRHAEISRNGAFHQTFAIDAPGTYRARASFADATQPKRSDRSDAHKTPLPSLSEGSHGRYVQLLEQRLVELHYRLVRIDQRYDFRTSDAMIAFHKVQGMTRTATVNAATWRAMADPTVPRARSHTDGFHIEIDQTRQVLYTVEDGAITNILHVSSGKASTPTHDGTFHVSRKIAGYSPNHLYYPSYFDGNRALHGWTDVPTYPASHGCVRIPYWNAKFIYGLTPIGTTVVVYHHS